MLAFVVRMAGAVALGMIYQFYYAGGDTFNYFTNGSKHIWDAFLDDPALGVKMLMSSGGEHDIETFEYSSRIWYFRDEHAYMVVRIVAFIDLFTFHTYSATALFFAVFSFSGLWMMFYALAEKYPERIKWMAFAVLFVPSVIFWGSGILKDTITMGALGWLTYAMINIISFKRRGLKYWIIVAFFSYLIFSIKSYILICYLPMVFVWIYWIYQQKVNNPLLKVVVVPVLLVVFTTLGYFALQQISSVSDKYSLDNIAQQAAVTAYDIRYGWGALTAGDGGYDLGVLDGSWGSMFKLMPQAINVSLFRPYLWEVRNPLMLLSALEALVVFVLTLRAFRNGQWKSIMKDPFLVFCLSFSLIFAFAVGVSTFNFGTLMRYKIPFVPFYGVMLFAKAPTKKRVVRKKPYELDAY